MVLRIRPILIFLRKPQRFTLSPDSSVGDIAESSPGFILEAGRDATDVGREFADTELSRCGKEESAKTVRGTRLRSPLREPIGPPRGRLSNLREGTSLEIGNGALDGGRVVPILESSSALFILRMGLRSEDVDDVLDEVFCLGGDGSGSVESRADR